MEKSDGNEKGEPKLAFFNPAPFPA